jgi:hypothetical protein
MRRESELPPPDCDTCDLPVLMHGNGPAWEVIQAAGPALCDGMGGINLANARVAAAALGYPWDREMLVKVMAWAQLMLEKADGD